jgi:hypothetical protein
MEYDHVTTEEKVSLYQSTNQIFLGLIKEVRELSKKKPDATLSKGKVSIINRALSDLQKILKEEPQGKFLDLLTDDELPQNSDGVLVMVQYESALRAFHARYNKRVYDSTSHSHKDRWITEEFLNSLEDEEKNSLNLDDNDDFYDLEDADSTI